MKNASQLLEEVKNERNREDKFLYEIQFEVRRNEVTMFFEYEEVQTTTQEAHYFKRHNHDPEILDIETFETLKKALDEEGIRYKQRRDMFM
ncbi:hypothetical protein [Staphylococcus intermedius]|uniref:Uncharacterized protein n=2 Tax=Staphylococcus intermedius TaxID=1285 RepID=A0A380G9Q1_STAIN|nr:hypothetical protein [Staphylococcus intermedius]PCF65227.1 hypothetical protein B5C04_04020 [Staphylococcus intermedius]PCF80838.1 hypothetical protein B4W74_04035 [Staphylococcus intermedius]PCF82187.1 hypothetical protein B4W70_04015 [Staphylococcus intermedius]PCF87449.1 hypothetical protein B4W76_03405 [Staphylococcus intermedius]PCF88523.1 hypothetical protein B4W75_07060 [Staphylococcus intermedius]